MREDLTAYLDASRTGFDAYKSGDAQLSQGYRMWTSSQKPAVATGCWVIQGDSTSTLSCVIPVNRATERAYYTELTSDVTASLPADWRASLERRSERVSPAPVIDRPAVRTVIWLVETADQDYELHYQLVSAPTRSRPPNAADDDPIGQGGFITPPTPPAPPSPPRKISSPRLKSLEAIREVVDSGSL